ncbi:MAG: ATP phosphoribosyltransferase [Candidatus Micrarchaeia archaeon]
MLKLAVPNKGRLYEPTLELLRRAGLEITDSGERALFGSTSNPEVRVLFVRADDIPRYVEMGAADAGITGYDLVQEKSADVAVLARLPYGMCRLSLAVPAGSGIKSVSDLQGKRIATKYVQSARKFLQKRGVKCKIVEIAGAAEITPFLGISDAIIDLVSTGTTLAIHKMREVEVLLESSACLVANRESLREGKKAELLKELTLSFEGCRLAESKRYIMVNAPSQAVLNRVVKIIPGMESPTVLKLAREGEYAVHAVVEESEIPRVIRQLKEAGAKDILVLRMERVVP